MHVPSAATALYKLECTAETKWTHEISRRDRSNYQGAVNLRNLSCQRNSKALSWRVPYNCLHLDKHSEPYKMIISWPYLLLWRRRILWYFTFILARRRFGALVGFFFFILHETDRPLRNHRKREDLFLSSRCYREKLGVEVPSLMIFFPTPKQQAI